MRARYIFLLLTLQIGMAMNAQNEGNFKLVIHGGAGWISRQSISDEKWEEYKHFLDSALLTGGKVLQAGGDATDAVIAAITILEDCPLFNAGKGAVFSHEERNEMDASIMDGNGQRAGAVAGVRHIKNPILAARWVMDSSAHVLLYGEGAEEFYSGLGGELVDSSYFMVPEKLERLREIKKGEQDDSQGMFEVFHDDQKHGTVGAVALDQNGHIAAATSTGGMTNKRWNRIGDSPIIGAGSWASDTTCGVSCTGHGEYFIRAAIAHSIHARMGYGGEDLKSAATRTIHGDLTSMGGTGGIIALDKDGNHVFEFNTPGMFRGVIDQGMTPESSAFGKEDE